MNAGDLVKIKGYSTTATRMYGVGFVIKECDDGFQCLVYFPFISVSGRGPSRWIIKSELELLSESR